jgi:hypothetical protein
MKHNILHNKYVLYFIFLIAFTDFLLLAYNNEFYYVLIFCIVGYLTYQFSRNMIVILSMSVAVTNIFKYVSQATVSEGFEDEEEDIIQEVKVEDEGEEAEGEDEEAEDVKEGEEEKEKEKEKEKSKEKIDKVFSSLSLEKDKPKKEKFSQDKNVVYTSEDDLEIERNERKMMSQVKMLKTMNKYKPLLDTLQGITKNLAIVKGMATQ